MTKTLRATLRLPSPNNMKVQIALAMKGLDYETDAVSGGEPETIAKLVEISGQPLTPILEHGDVTIYDSGAILRYIDANFPGPRLFSPDRTEMKTIEDWESFHSNKIFGALRPALQVFFGGLEGPETAEMIKKSNGMLHEVTSRVEECLEVQANAGSEWLVGTTMTAADIFVACSLGIADLPAGLNQWNPLWKWTDSNLSLGADRERTKAHVARVLKLLPVPVGA
jgi:glutathione S-transferase